MSRESAPAMTALEAANLFLRLLLEIFTLIALFSWGVMTFWPLAIVAPIAAALTWGTFIAPRAKIRLEDPLRLAIEVAFFAAGVVALAASGAAVLAVLLAVAVVLHIGLMLHLKQR